MGVSIMPTLKYWNGTAWVPLMGVPFSDEVIIQSTPPGATGYDLWVDTSVPMGSDSILALLENPPKCSFQRNAQVSLGANIWGMIPWDITNYDPMGMWASGSPTRLVAPVAGVYSISAAAILSYVASNVRVGVGIFYNGNMFRTALVPATTGTAVTGAVITADVYMNANDYVEIAIFSQLATTLPANNPTYNFVTMRWESP